MCAVQWNARVIVCLISLSIVCGGLAWAGDDLKIACVNVDELFDKYSKTVELNKKLDQEVQGKQAERDAMVNDIKKMREEIALLSDDHKQQKQDAVDEKIKALQKYDESVREEILEKRNTYMKEVLIELDEKVKKYCEDKKYDYVFNSRLLIYKKDAFDITADVLTSVNKD